MAFRIPLRSASRMMASRASAPSAAAWRHPVATRSFHAARPLFVRVGDEVPDLDVLVEDSPGNKVNLHEEFTTGGGNGLIVGVPAAFSGACSATHIPSYINHPKLKDAGQIFVVSVNDAFV